jgi:hypothetical protein
VFFRRGVLPCFHKNVVGESLTLMKKNIRDLTLRFIYLYLKVLYHSLITHSFLYWWKYQTKKFCWHIYISIKHHDEDVWDRLRNTISINVNEIIYFNGFFLSFRQTRDRRYCRMKIFYSFEHLSLDILSDVYIFKNKIKYIVHIFHK